MFPARARHPLDLEEGIHTQVAVNKELAIADVTRTNGTAIVQDHPGAPFARNWGAAHPGGARFAFCDGSVRTLTYSTPRAIVAALLTPQGGEVVPDP